MKCPLMIMGCFNKGGTWSPESEKCIKEECAWWDNADEQCVAKTIAFEISTSRNALQTMGQTLSLRGRK